MRGGRGQVPVYAVLVGLINTEVPEFGKAVCGREGERKRAHTHTRANAQAKKKKVKSLP